MDKRFTGIMRRSAAVILCLLFLAASFWTGGTSAASSMSGPCGTVEEIHAAFPESYWKSLEALLAAHPNWRFKAFYEGVTFEECMADTAEMMIRRNLVEGKNESYPGGYYYPTSWYSTDIEGAYNWAGNEFYGFDNGNMFQASEEAVRYCMDPRNWFTEEQIFQFLDSTTPFDPSVSEQIVEYIFSTIGVDMWVAPAEETGLYTYEPAEDTKVAGAYETNTAAGSQTETANESSSSSEAPVSSTEVQTESQAASSEAPGSSSESSEASSGEPATDPSGEPIPEGMVKVCYTYAQAVNKIAAELVWQDAAGVSHTGANQATMATRIRQEHGSGKSKLIAGDYAFTVTSEPGMGQVIPGGYYNYFAMDASGNSIEQIYNNGLTEAYHNGWDTRYKSIAGGMKRYTERYFYDCQYCPYMLKFNVRSDSRRQYWGQYMQDLIAPQNEAKNLYKAISSVEGAMDAPMTFIIPVFDELPETVSPEPDPNRIGNPNYKLGSIYAGGKSVGWNAETQTDSFNTDVLEYNLTVSNDTTSFRLNIGAYAQTTRIAVGEQTGMGSLAFNVNLKYGANVFKIVSTAENGLSRTYTVNIIRSTSAELSSLTVNGELIKGFDPDVFEYSFTVQNKVTELTFGAAAVSNDAVVSFKDSGGNSSIEVTPSLLLGDNDIVFTVTGADGTVKTYKIRVHRDGEVVYGDINADSAFDSLDLAYLTSHLLRINILTDLSLESADINGDGSIDSLDLAYLTAYLLGSITEFPR